MSISCFRFLISCPSSAYKEDGKGTGGCLLSDAMSAFTERRSSLREFISLLMKLENTSLLVGRD